MRGAPRAKYGTGMAELQLKEAETGPAGVGPRLRAAREALGWSRAQLAARTKIPERHLAAIESGNFAALPARTYAVGFTRSYAREVGLAEAGIVADLRGELDGIESGEPRVASFEPGDPARIPAGGLAWIAALAALAVVIAVVVIWRPFYSPAMTLPPLKPDPVPSAPARLAPAAASAAGVLAPAAATSAPSGAAISDGIVAPATVAAALPPTPAPRPATTDAPRRRESAAPAPSASPQAPVDLGSAAPGASTVSE